MVLFTNLVSKMAVTIITIDDVNTFVRWMLLFERDLNDMKYQDCNVGLEISNKDILCVIFGEYEVVVNPYNHDPGYTYRNESAYLAHRYITNPNRRGVCTLLRNLQGIVDFGKIATHYSVSRWKYEKMYEISQKVCMFESNVLNVPNAIYNDHESMFLASWTSSFTQAQKDQIVADFNN